VAAALAFAVATAGGISSLVVYVIHPQIRCWGRLSVFIAFFSLFALLLRVDSQVRGAGARAGLLAGLLIFGLLEQTSPAQAPNYARLKADFENDGDLVARIERRLPAGAAVFQLPYVPFPEALPVYELQDSTQLRPYLHSRALRFSYGAMKGRPEDWAAELADEPVPSLLRGVTAAGFTGLMLNRAGYPDRGAALEAAVTSLVGEAPLASRDGDVTFFDLRPLSDRLASTTPPGELARLRESILKPIRCVWGEGFFAEERSPTARWRWAGTEARLEIANGSAQECLVTLEAAFGARGGGTVHVTWPDGRREQLPLGVRWTRSVRLRPGDNVVAFSTDLPRVPSPGDPRDLHLMFVDPACHEPDGR
jgi:phosphoglycerol transferase